MPVEGALSPNNSRDVDAILTSSTGWRMGTPLSLFLFSEECPHTSEGLQTGSGQGAVRFLWAVIRSDTPPFVLPLTLFFVGGLAAGPVIRCKPPAAIRAPDREGEVAHSPPRSLYPQNGHSTLVLLSALKRRPHLGHVETGRQSACLRACSVGVGP